MDLKNGKRKLLYDLLRKMFKSKVGGGGRHHRLYVYRVQAVLQAAGTTAGTSLFVCKNKHRKELLQFWITYAVVFYSGARKTINLSLYVEKIH